MKPKKLNREKEKILHGYIIIYLFIYLFIIFAFTDLVNTNKYHDCCLVKELEHSCYI